MRAAVYHGPHRVEIEDVPTPEPGPGEVAVDVAFNGICGTDLHEYYAGPIFVPTSPHPLTGRQAPLTMGHEFSGTVAAVGPVETALACVGSRRPMVSVAIYETPLETPLLNLVMNESRIQGSLCYTAADYEAVIALMDAGTYDTTGWVEHIALEDVVTEGFDALHAGRKTKVLVDPTR
ncbi:alcohol dehydrogenase catalytic domain-containing protein [Rhodococcus kroppenstedtii]|uniref:alcohol dehydrogenase catalytic domain-containing protein n=1 Tax=Rhodococcoides kroppenstedtii TaxID=293050 RepID=UPI0029554A06|nr:alcohol dehydrogenase catalytic domain-containing protein [Rhodococcus kroppenstedtii]MDV7199235.1 alcohol dehydrogenase catalytic domain-containing protein [Rhodococcus kroppenstedtii]